ncbi:MAG TPA: chitobiase/beta-hexosaminidase C-terminal domain-containing protein [Rectinemataceae bacterium]|nr:chitobiase/beta-hexosaminidase C-terminal domain-containing protein [Rectinemataceae bacterium]
MRRHSDFEDLLFGESALADASAVRILLASSLLPTTKVGRGFRTVFRVFLSLAIFALASSCDLLGGVVDPFLEKTSEPVFSPGEGTFANDIAVSLECSTAGAIIYWSADGSTPSVSSNVYQSPIGVSGNNTTATIKAFAQASGKSASAVISKIYQITYDSATSPVFSPLGGTFISDTNVTISPPAGLSNPIIHYMIDGSVSGWQSYSGPISVAGNGTTMTIYAYLTADGLSDSPISSQTYSIAYPAAIAPTFSPGGITFDATTKAVTITSIYPSGTISYTIDGSDPTSSGTASSAPGTTANIGTLSIDPPLLVRAVVDVAGYSTSPESSASYSGFSMVTLAMGITMGTINRLEGYCYFDFDGTGNSTYGSITVGTHEITQGEFQYILDQYVAGMANPAISLTQPSYYSNRVDAKTRPVENLTWYDAARFCNLVSTLRGLSNVYTFANYTVTSGHITAADVTANFSLDGYRLPTELEWELIARVVDATGTTQPRNVVNSYPWGTDFSLWYLYEYGGSETARVGQYLGSPVGLHDLLGNVYEWTWGSNATLALTSPAPGVKNYRLPVLTVSSTDIMVARGGANYGDRNCARAPSYKYLNIGLRVVRGPILP